MEVGAGYFARVRFATDSEISIRFVKDMAALAHEAVENAQRYYSGSSGGDNKDPVTSSWPSNLTDRAVGRNPSGDILEPGDLNSVSCS